MSARAVKKNEKKSKPRYRRRLVLDVYSRGAYHYTKIKGWTRPAAIGDYVMIPAGAPARGRYRLTITRDPAGTWVCDRNDFIMNQLSHIGFTACYMRVYQWGPKPFHCTVTFQPASLWRVARHQ